MKLHESLLQMDTIISSNKGVFELQVRLKERIMNHNIEKELIFHQNIFGERNNGKTHSTKRNSLR